MPTPHHSDDTTLTLAIDSTFQVDPAKGELRNLAVMTGGRVASGHGIYLDQKTIDTAFAATGDSGQLRAAIRHQSIMDLLARRGDRVLDMPGYFSDLRVDGNKLVAGKFEFFETFKTANPAIAARILEMAAKTPKLFGLSAEPSGTLVYVGLDGKDYPIKRDPETGDLSAPPKDVALANQGLPTLRVRHLGVAAFVDQPAANDSLFAKLSSLFGGEQKEFRALVKELATAFKAEFSASAVAPTAATKTASMANGTLPPPGLTTDTGATANSPENNPPPMITFAQITAKFGADKARLAQALELASQNPEITIEALESKIVAGEVAALSAQIADLTTKLAAANKAAADAKTAHEAALAAVTADRDAYKAKFGAIKNSGGEKPFDLGTGAKTPADGKTVRNLSSADAWGRPEGVILRGAPASN